MDKVVQLRAVSPMWDRVEGRQRQVGMRAWGWDGDGMGQELLCSAACTAGMKMIPPITNSNQRLHNWMTKKSTLVLIPSSRIRCGVDESEGFLISLPRPHSWVDRWAGRSQLHQLVWSGQVRFKIHDRILFFSYRKDVNTVRLLQGQVIES